MVTTLIRDGISGMQVEKFTTETVKCSCCDTRYHVYMFLSTDRSKCIGCKRDCSGRKSCRLGFLHDH